MVLVAFFEKPFALVYMHGHAHGSTGVKAQVDGILSALEFGEDEYRIAVLEGSMGKAHLVAELLFDDPPLIVQKKKGNMVQKGVFYSHKPVAAVEVPAVDLEFEPDDILCYAQIEPSGR
jgi:hypothetical protein